MIQWMQWMQRTMLVAAGCLWATTARADMLGPGEKGVQLSIQVDASVPAGKTLVLANTFRGADLVTPNAVTPVEWHPLGGDLQLRLLAKTEADKIPPLREKLDREAVRPIAAAGLACGNPFPGVRTIPESSPATEVRWTFNTTIAGDACSAALVRTAYLDKDGKVVPPPGNTDIPPPSPPDVKAPSKTEVPKPEAPKPEAPKTEAPKPDAPKPAAGCGCTSDADPPAGLLTLVFAGLLRRRR